MLGGLAPFPIRLGGTPEGGIRAAAHARAVADLCAIRRGLPLARMDVSVASGVVTLHAYSGRNGAGLAYAPALAGTATAGEITVTWPLYYEDETGRVVRWRFTGVSVTVQGTTARFASYNPTFALSSIQIYNIAEVETDGRVSIVFHGYEDDATFADYDGTLDKRDDITENPVPYAGHIYRDIQQQRGSAYTTKARSLVHCENVAMARMWAHVSYRLPDKLRNNSTPLLADEGVEYWSKLLGIPIAPDEPRFETRRRLAVHYRLGDGAVFDSLRSKVKDLLGSAFGSVTLNHGADLANPPANTYWPTINPGLSIYDLGGGSWLSERAQVLVDVIVPGGVQDAKFNRLVNVELFELLDRELPIWATAQWRDSASVTRAVWDGFYWDDGTKWDDLFDWNA